MGVILNDTIDFNVIANVLADVGGRALGAIINKYKKLGGLGYTNETRKTSSLVGYTYTTMYNAEIWGYKEYPKINTIQNRAIRVFIECIILHQIWV